MRLLVLILIFVRGESSKDESKKHFEKGNEYYIKGLYEEAEKELRETIRINPDDADAHNNLGVLLYK
ncbi:TPA: hypothetical protein DIT23_00885 [candidate division WOR-3 bacterium]|nr:hypothetical protein [candidate division WOR-3 bacterium]